MPELCGNLRVTILLSTNWISSTMCLFINHHEALLVLIDYNNLRAQVGQSDCSILLNTLTDNTCTLRHVMMQYGYLPY